MVVVFIENLVIHNVSRFYIYTSGGTRFARNARPNGDLYI